MCLVYVREPLQQAERLQAMLLATMWIMHGELLIEKETSTMSTDIIHNYLGALVPETCLTIESCFASLLL